MVRPLPTSTGMSDGMAIALGLLGFVSLGYVGLHPRLETLVIGVPGGLFVLLLAWLGFSASRSSWTLRLQTEGFVHARTGRWFPHGNRILRGALHEVSTIRRHAIRGPGRHLFARLGRYRLDLASQTRSHAEALEAIWTLYQTDGRVETLPPASLVPKGMGHVLIAHRLPHAVQVYSGQARLSAAKPSVEVFVHRGHNLWGVDTERYRELAPRLDAVASAGLPHVQPALAVVSLDGTPAVLSAPAAGLDLHQISQRHGPLPPSVCLELAARIAETIAAASNSSGANKEGLPGHGRLEAGMVLLDSTGTLSILEYAIQPVPQPPGQALFSFGSLPRVFSPEYLNGSAPTDDRYALGVVLLELLDGRPPFWDVSTLEFLRASVRAERQAAMVHDLLNACRDRLSPEVRALVGELLSFEPTARPDRGRLAARCRTLAARGNGPTVEDWACDHDLSLPAVPDEPLCKRVHVVGLLGRRTRLIDR